MSWKSKGGEIDCLVMSLNRMVLSQRSGSTWGLSCLEIQTEIVSAIRGEMRFLSADAFNIFKPLSAFSINLNHSDNAFKSIPTVTSVARAWRARKDT